MAGRHGELGSPKGEGECSGGRSLPRYVEEEPPIRKTLMNGQKGNMSQSSSRRDARPQELTSCFLPQGFPALAISTIVSHILQR